MRKKTHPFLKETLIQTKDGSIFLKRWLYFRSFLPLDIDISVHSMWKKNENKKKLDTLKCQHYPN